MPILPPAVPPLRRERPYKRDVPASAAVGWLRAGWHDLKQDASLSLAYGTIIFMVSLAIVYSLVTFGYDYILFPVLAGFMVVGPFIAIGLYEKSRRVEAGEPTTLAGMLFVKADSGGQIMFIGALLCILMLLWMRAAVIIYALFFGLTPFPGLDDIAATLFFTPTGWTMLVVGTVVGGLFAAFAFAISAFSIPMLLNERTDALTAMGTSMALVWNNLPVMLTWGAIVLGLFIVSVLTAFIGLIVVFPLLGHATWHAYRTIRH